MPYRHFTPFERGQMQVFLKQGISLRAIGRELGRNVSSVWREFNRNGGVAERYDAERAQKRYHRVRKNCVRTRSLDYPPLRRYVLDKIFENWSPEQVSGRLWLDFEGIQRMRISHEAIYRSLYSDERLGKILIPSLRQRRPRRRKRAERRATKPFIPNRVSIDERPPQVDALERYGDWEGDTIIGKNHEGAIVTLVERKSMLLLAAHVPSKHAKGVAEAIIEVLRKMPRDWVRTITFDNGSEFARHQDITKQTKAQIYFAHPYASYERGKNENTNGLLRQYYPKKTSFVGLDPDKLRRIVHEINNRPRKNLGYRTPLEVFNEHSVALEP